MKKNNHMAMRIVQMILAFLTVAVFVFFIWGEMVLPEENQTESGKCQKVHKDWVQETKDGRLVPVTLPGNCEAEYGEWVSISTEIPKYEEKMCYCFRSLQHDFKIYVGDELRKEYSTIDTQLFGKTSTIAYVFVEVMPEDAGKRIRLDFMSDSSYASVIGELYIGQKADVWHYLITTYGASVILAIFMLLLGISVVGLSVLLRVIYKKKIDLAYLGVAIMLASTWLISESKLRQFFLPNATMAMYMGFFMIMLLPFPFLGYINIVQKGRFQRAYMVVVVWSLINFIVCTTLQIFEIKDFFETMLSSHLVLGATIILILTTIMIDMRKKRLAEYRLVAVGLAGFLISGLWELALAYVMSSRYNGMALCVGLVFLLAMAGLKSGKDLISVEKEKQLAIAASKSKAQFLASMSHEIRTPINTVIGMNEMILRESQDDTITEYAQYINSSSRMLLGLINDVLDFSKIEAGKIQFVENDYYSSSMLSDVVLGIKVRAEEKGLRMNLAIDEKIPQMLRGDEIRIKQVLNNLLSNAVKYTEQGSITFSAQGVWEQEQFYLDIAVEDTGIGIREEDLDKLFESFLRLELKKNRNIEGSGLGLSITKKLVDNMQGTMKVTSEYGKGSCFSVRIPQIVVNAIPMGKLGHKKMMSTRDGKAESYLRMPDARILVVDDNQMNLKVMKALLKRTQIQVDVASGGNECLQMTKNQIYDLILMDHMMPEPDGVQTLHSIRGDANNVNQETEIIVLTANAVEGAAEEYKNYGFSDYLTKPVDSRRLEDMLGKFLKRKKAEAVSETEVVSVPEEKKEIVIDREEGLRFCGGDEEFYKEILEEYYNMGQGYLEKLPEHLKQKNWKEYSIIAHSIKSNSKTIGAVEFAERALQHEMAAKEENETFLIEDHETFMQEYQEMIEYVKNM